MLRIDYNIIAKLRPLWLFAFPVCASSYYSLSPFFFVFVSGSFFFAYLLNCSNRFHSTNINILKMCKREGNTLSLSVSLRVFHLSLHCLCRLIFWILFTEKFRRNAQHKSWPEETIAHMVKVNCVWMCVWVSVCECASVHVCVTEK